jgi:hypothetical protein
MKRQAGQVSMTAADPTADIAATSPYVAEVPIVLQKYFEHFVAQH